MNLKSILFSLIFLALLSMQAVAGTQYPNVTFITGNGTNFSVDYGNTTNSTNSMNLTLIGQGINVLTFYAPNISGQTNITVGYGCTNCTLLRVNWTNSTTAWLNNTINITTYGSVSNPIIKISVVNELQSGNLPGAILATGTISGLVIVYKYLRRRRRH